jgi:hypothetical protein
LGIDLFSKKSFNFVYRIVLPVITLILLIGIASFNDRPIVTNSFIFDFLIRCVLSAWFCSLYIRLPQFSSFGYYPNIKWKKEDVGRWEKYWIIGMICFFCFFSGIMTFWIFRVFLPTTVFLEYFVSILNSVVIFYPMYKHYWVMKL